MNVLVTGATGFVGRHVVAALVERGHAVTAVSRTFEKGQAMPWFNQVKFVECDVYLEFEMVLALRPRPDVLVHLSWPGLPNYKDAFHLEQNLPAEMRLAREAVSAGVPRIVVAGTCLEYGMKFGPLAASDETRPVTPYGLAKDTLRKALEMLQSATPFTLQWVRLFYMYGEGQNPGSLLSQLDRAIAEGALEFNMSRGDQLRDYLPVEDVAACFAKVVADPDIRGVINCCSGRPVSVRELVERRCAERGARIRLNRGHFPYPDYEPLAFWGVPTVFPDR